MSRIIDLTGMKFERWTVISRYENTIQGATTWSCECSCGENRVVLGKDLRTGKSKSCGCYRNERISIATSTHGYSHKNSPEYTAWAHIKQRCMNINNPKYKDYGERGIKMCDDWKESFECFLKDMGKRPKNSTSIDRKDVNGNYEPDNCRWSNTTEQARNKRIFKKNKTGVSGVNFDKSCRKFRAEISVNNLRIYLGKFLNLEDAIESRKKAEIKYWGKSS